jgi:hypothetical protein
LIALVLQLALQVLQLALLVLLLQLDVEQK